MGEIINEYWSAKVAESCSEMLSEQRQQNYEYNRLISAPHIVHNAEIEQMDGGKWCCFLGNIATGVVGIGSTPKEACEEFDRVWGGEV